jgi:hypothetical protein
MRGLKILLLVAVGEFSVRTGGLEDHALN